MIFFCSKNGNQKPSINNDTQKQWPKEKKETKRQIKIDNTLQKTKD